MSTEVKANGRTWNVTLEKSQRCEEHWEHGFQIHHDEIKATRCFDAGVHLRATEKLTRSRQVEYLLSNRDPDPSKAPRTVRLKTPAGMDARSFMKSRAALNTAITSADAPRKTTRAMHPGDPANERWDPAQYFEFQSLSGN